MSSQKTHQQPELLRTYVIARMTEHHLLEVVEIEEHSRLSKWGWEAYHKELTQETGALMFVAKLAAGDSSPIHGFVAARLAADELHINNVAVRDTHRRFGIGKALLERVITEAKQCGARKAFLEARAANRAALGLYRRVGFKEIGRRPAYYSEPTEDAVLMSLVLRHQA